MQIKMLASRFGPGRVLHAEGTTYTVDDSLALQWIGDNAAVDVGNTRLGATDTVRHDPTKQEQISGIALVSGAGSLASPMLIAKTNATFSRVSANTAADNTFGTLYSFLLPGGSMGPNGTLRWEAELGFTDPNTNAGTTVGFQLRIGATAISPEVGGTYTAGQTFANQSLEWHNTAVAAQKYRGSFAKNGGSGSGFFTTSIDTAVDQTIDFACRWSGATPSETLSLLSLRVWVEYGA